MNMVSIAKRENNNKRKYLVVNRLQGKHIPVSGRTALEVFDSLSQKVSENLKDEKILVVGFAETATAIGARLAVSLDCEYIQTTREQVDKADYLYFTESHSHATEQKLVKNDIESIIDRVDRIVFAEDEVTTGNTIMKIIRIIQRLYPDRVRFAVASLLNGMNSEALEVYSENNIDVFYILKTYHDTYTEIAEGFSGDGEYIGKNTTPCNINIARVKAGYLNTRRLVRGSEYNKVCEELFLHIKGDVDLSVNKTIAVIGTEEFMYPALYIASRFEDLGAKAVTHSTTRSPIAVSTEEDYPVNPRYELSSFYDSDRKTFIYNLKCYDCVVVVTDSPNPSRDGVNSLVNALKSVGNENIKIYRWCSDD